MPGKAHEDRADVTGTASVARESVLARVQRRFVFDDGLVESKRKS